MDELNPIDDKWIRTLGRFIGGGEANQPVPCWRLPDGSVDSNRTLECIFGMFGIHPVKPTESSESSWHYVAQAIRNARERKIE